MRVCRLYALHSELECSVGYAGWSCDNLEVNSRQNILEHARTWFVVAPFSLVSIVIIRHD